jgi:hypothetical protein
MSSCSAAVEQEHLRCALTQIKERRAYTAALRCFISGWESEGEKESLGESEG